MTTAKATIVKIGNSYGVRLKRQYLVAADVEPGDVVELTIRKAHKPDKAKAMAALQAIAELGGPLTRIDPVAWQREQRQSTSPWENVGRDS